MDLALDKNIKKNRDSHQKQKKDKNHYRLDQDSIKEKLADTYIFNSGKKADSSQIISKSLYKNLLANKKHIFISLFLIVFSLFILKELGLGKYIGLNSIGKNEFNYFGGSILSKDSIVFTNLNFYGNFYENSKLTQEYIYLGKRRGAKSAGVEIKLKNSIDINKGALLLLAKGEIGEEKLTIILKDASNPENDLIKEIKISPHFGNLSQNWQKILIPFDQIKEKNLLMKISSIAFEICDSKKFNSKASCYLKNIILLNE